MPMLYYYGLVVVGIAAIVLAVYNFIILRWCASHRGHMPQQPTPRSRGPLSIPPSFGNRNMQLAVSFKYKKEQGKGDEDQEAGHGYECPVCLSAFEDGEEVRQLHRCKHSFHVVCIDVWLYSHFNCPVCRAPVDPLFLRRHEPTDQSENSREVLIGSMAV